MNTPIALVTGGANRIGRAICLKLASQGYGVVVHYRSSDVQAKKTQEACRAAGANLTETFCCDLSDPLARADLIDAVTDLAGPISLLVNNASSFEFDDAQSFSSAQFEKHLQTNYLAPVELTMALHRNAARSGIQLPRHVVTLLDQKVMNLNADFMSYTLAKLASHASIRYLAQCCAPVLRVNAIAPGVTLVSGEMGPDDFAKAHKIAALGRSSTLDDIASAVWLMENSPAVTGQTLVVDGGQHLVPRIRDVAFDV